MLRNILIVSESFPPVNHIAARRFGGIAPHLEAQGWRPWVLTMHSRGPLPVELPEPQVIRIGEYPHAPADLPGVDSDRPPLGRRLATGLLRPVKSLVKRSGFQFRTLYRGQFGWYRQVVRKETAMLQRLPPLDLVVGSFSPTAGLLLARRFAEQANVPWIADFRDLAGLRTEGNNRLSAAIDRRVERWMMQSAAGITTVSPTLAAILQSAYRRPAQVVFNGWHEYGESSRFSASHSTESCNAAAMARGLPYLYYAGRLYVHQMPAMQLLLNAMREQSQVQLVTRLLGPVVLERELRRMVGQLQLADRVHLLPPCAPHTADAESSQAQANVVLEDLGSGEEATRGTVTGKLLKLLPQRPPILCIARADSDIGPILSGTGKGRLCSTGAAVGGFLRETGTASDLYGGNQAAVEEYSMRRQAAHLARFFDEISTRPPIAVKVPASERCSDALEGSAWLSSA